jgi:hypothetical protein
MTVIIRANGRMNVRSAVSHNDSMKSVIHIWLGEIGCTIPLTDGLDAKPGFANEAFEPSIAECVTDRRTPNVGRIKNLLPRIGVETHPHCPRSPCAAWRGNPVIISENGIITHVADPKNECADRFCSTYGTGRDLERDADSMTLLRPIEFGVDL